MVKCMLAAIKQYENVANVQQPVPPRIVIARDLDRNDDCIIGVRSNTDYGRDWANNALG
jgi:hypothetical protein